MSIRRGLNLIAGAGAVPYVSDSTFNWEVMGVDSGKQAVPYRVTCKQFHALNNPSFTVANDAARWDLSNTYKNHPTNFHVGDVVKVTANIKGNNQLYFITNLDRLDCEAGYVWFPGGEIDLVNKMYYLIDAIPRLFTDISIPVNAWKVSGDTYVTTIRCDDFLGTDMANIDIAASCSDDNYFDQYQTMVDCDIRRIQIFDGYLTISAAVKPSDPFTIDIVTFKTIPISQSISVDI